MASGETGNKWQLKSYDSYKSKVWKYFGFPVNDAGTITNKKGIYCNLCYHKLSCLGTNLFNNVQATTYKHPSQFSEIARKKKTSTDVPGESGSQSSAYLTPKRAVINTWFYYSKSYTCQSSRYQCC